MKNTLDSLIEDRNKNVLNNIRWLRKKRNLSQAEVSDALGFTPSNYGKIESGATSLQTSVLLSLSVVLNTHARNFFMEPEDFQQNIEMFI